MLAGCQPAGKSADPTGTPAAAVAGVPASTEPASTEPPPTTEPPTVAPATVPSLVGQAAAQARTALAQHGLRVGILYVRTTAQRAGTVIAQSVRAGAGVAQRTLVVLTVAVAPPPPPKPASSKPAPPVPAPPTGRPQPPAPPSGCDPAYPGSCLKDGIGDYDCAGSGNGPNHVQGPIRVLPPDPFGLDRDHDGVGCE